MLSKKDYIKLAKILNDRKNDIKSYALINDIAEWLKEDNPNFNSEKFFEAINYFA